MIGVDSALYTTATSTGNIGIGFAIPINDAKFLVAHMRDIGSGKMRPAYLGAKVQSLTPDLGDAYGLQGPWGSIVQQVQDGSPAAQAKLRAGDIITSFGNKFTKDSRALVRAIVATLPGTTVILGVLRGGNEEIIPVTLTGLPANELDGDLPGRTGCREAEASSRGTGQFWLGNGGDHTRASRQVQSQYTAAGRRRDRGCDRQHGRK